jgi:hypothetical protein
MSFPQMIPLQQRFNAESLEDPVGDTTRSLAALDLTIRPGARIGVAGGSRGIANIAPITRAVVDHLKERGAEPFILPAMGSHGGASAKGQKEVLASYGISPETMGVPVESTMDVEEVGVLEDGTPVLLNRLACQADGIVLINRIKPHTSFRGLFESGLMKMMTIGLGSHKGATMAHSQGAEGLARLIPQWGQVILEKAPILAGIALVENAYEKTAVVEALTPDRFTRREPQLLALARENMPRIMLHDIDLLIVEEMGKNISGTGMDTNVLGRMMLPGVKEPNEPGVKRIVTLGLSDKTHGNANGVGLADIITRRLFDGIDFQATYANAFTSTFLNRAYVPVIMETDQKAIQAAFEVQRIDDPTQARVVRIKNTLEVVQIQASEPMLRDADKHPDIDRDGSLAPMAFDAEERLI